MDFNFFAENLRYLRQVRGYTLIECGDFFDLGKSQISLYENAKSYPPIPIARKICNHFGVSLSDMFETDLRPGQPPNGKRTKLEPHTSDPPQGSEARVVEMDVGGVSTATESPPEERGKVQAMERKLLEMMLELQDMKR